jgi:ketosteroid isomerase-like protein
MPLPRSSTPGEHQNRPYSEAVSENLTLVRAILASWERGDMTAPEWAQWAHPDIEFIVVGGPEPSRHVGLAAATPQIEAFMALWDDYRVEAEKYYEVDEERVLVLTRQSGRGKTSGVEIRQPRATLFHIRDGKVTRRVNYWDRRRALTEVGLAE